MGASGPSGAAVRRCAEVIAAREPVVHAWACLDLPRATADAALADRSAVRPMSGMTLGVKDIFDTAEQPTSYGSPLFRGHRPRVDAAAVALLRGAGAISLGKTVTAELACAHPGPTTNPHRATHTPGGSSMGSAAAVATGMADIALGTQTAGSIIRPASFCGIYGFRPTFGAVSVAGVKLVAPSLDTVGWFARDAAHLDLVHACLTGRSRALPPTMPALGVARTPCWNSASPDTRQAVYGALRRAREAGAVTGPVRSEQLLDGLERAQQVMTAYEAARSLAWEHGHRDQLSSSLLALLDAGRALDPTDYDEARRRRDRAVAGLDGLFGDAAVLLAPAVVGEAPAGLDGTGDPVFSRAWSLLGLPAAAIPWAQGYTGLPVGVQLIGRPGDDLAVLAAARWFAALLPA